MHMELPVDLVVSRVEFLLLDRVGSFLEGHWRLWLWRGVGLGLLVEDAGFVVGLG